MQMTLCFLVKGKDYSEADAHHPKVMMNASNWSNKLYLQLF